MPDTVSIINEVNRRATEQLLSVILDKLSMPRSAAQSLTNIIRIDQIGPRSEWLIDYIKSNPEDWIKIVDPNTFAPCVSYKGRGSLVCYDGDRWVIEYDGKEISERPD